VIAIKVILDRAVAETLAFEVVFVARQTQLFRRNQKEGSPIVPREPSPASCQVQLKYNAGGELSNQLQNHPGLQFPHLLETSCCSDLHDDTMTDVSATDTNLGNWDSHNGAIEALY
jgi:hypothetical protein